MFATQPSGRIFCVAQGPNWTSQFLGSRSTSAPQTTEKCYSCTLAAIACGRCSSGREMPDRKKSDTLSTCLRASRNITIARTHRNHARRSLEQPVRQHQEPTPNHPIKAQFNHRRRPARSTPSCLSRGLNPMSCRRRFRLNGISAAPPAPLDRRHSGFGTEDANYCQRSEPSTTRSSCSAAEPAQLARSFVNLAREFGDVRSTQAVVSLTTANCLLSAALGLAASCSQSGVARCWW